MPGSALSPAFSGVRPKVKEIVSIYAEIIQIAAPLEDLSAIRDRTGVAIAHATEIRARPCPGRVLFLFSNSISVSISFSIWIWIVRRP